MKPWYSNTPIHRAGVISFLLFIAPVSILGLYLLLSINHELRVLKADPNAYDFHAEVIEDSGLIRGAFAQLRKLTPNYQEADAATEYLRDLRLVLIIVWGSLMAGGIALVRNISVELRRQVQLISRGVEQLAHRDLSQPISIVAAAELQELGEQLDLLRTRLQRSEQQQLEFLQHVSHEIKTPLASIREGIKLMGDQLLGEMNPEQAEVSDIIIKNSRELQASIESLLDYNAALVQRQEKDRQDVNLKQLVEQALNRQSLALRAKNIALDLNLENITAKLNPAQFLTVCDNLLSNAIRFSPRDGRIHITVNKINEQIELTVQDQGPGIPNEQKLSVFNAFYTGQQPNSDEIKGSGLGLSIARQYVELHQGTIEVIDAGEASESDLLEFGGATLKVSIPNE